MTEMVEIPAQTTAKPLPVDPPSVDLRQNGRHPARLQNLELNLPSSLCFSSSISQIVQSSMPSLKSALHLLRNVNRVSTGTQMVQRPQKLAFNQDLALPNPKGSPISIAHRLLQIALGLQQLCEMTSAQEAARRYFDAVTCQVTSQDCLVLSCEGLEVLMLEALYQINAGNLRLAWMCFRRAVSIAQLLKLSGYDTPADSSKGASITSAQQLLWLQIVYGDRFLSLLLGLPYAHGADVPCAPAMSTSLGQLNRQHMVIMGRIIARQQRLYVGKHTNLSSEIAESWNIDQELRKIMRIFPTEWWLLPELSVRDWQEGNDDRLLAHAEHANLLLVLHIPFALTYLSTDVHFEYGTNMYIATIASRDLLSRYILYRKFNQLPTCCRTIDLKAFTAAAILLLAHINGHRIGQANMLAYHQQDLGLIDIVVETVTSLERRASNVQSKTVLCILEQLQMIERRAVAGILHDINVNLATTGEVRFAEGDINVEFTAPHFGTVRIGRSQRPDDTWNHLFPSHTGTTTLGPSPARFECHKELPALEDFVSIDEHSSLNYVEA